MQRVRCFQMFLFYCAIIIFFRAAPREYEFHILCRIGILEFRIVYTWYIDVSSHILFSFNISGACFMDLWCSSYEKGNTERPYWRDLTASFSAHPFVDSCELIQDFKTGREISHVSLVIWKEIFMLRIAEWKSNRSCWLSFVSAELPAGPTTRRSESNQLGTASLVLKCGSCRNHTSDMSQILFSVTLSVWEEHCVWNMIRL
jgi:hypothetical protein